MSESVISVTELAKSDPKPVLVLPIPSKMSNDSAKQAEIAGNMQMIPSDTSVCDTRCRDKDSKPPGKWRTY